MILSTDARKIFCLLVLGILLGAGVAAGAGVENGGLRVRRYRFEGMGDIRKKDLMANLAVKPPPAWRVWEPLPVATRREIEEDALRVRQYYQSQGYYEATVRHEVTLTPLRTADDETAPLADVVFWIAEGPPVLIRNIVLKGLESVADLDAAIMGGDTGMAPGRRFIVEDYEQAKVLIRKALGNQGYPFAKVDGRAVVDLNDNRADVVFEVAPGERYVFGDIRVSGHEAFVKERVIRRAVAIAPNEQYSAKALDESRANLFDLTIFKTASIRAGEPDVATKTLPVDIVVKPRKKQSVKFGVGYGTDDGLRLQGAWTYRNLTGRADRLSIRARRSDITENIYGEYLFPYFLSSRNDLAATAGYEHEEKDYYTLNRTAAETILYHKLRKYWTVSTGYRLEANRPENVKTASDGTVMDPRDTENFLVSAANLAVERSTVDDVLHSTRGVSVRLYVEKAAGFLGSEVNYLRPGLAVKAFAPLPWKMVLAARGDFQTFRKSEDTDYIPISKQFFMGGSKSVRGYGYEKMGVVNTRDEIVDISGLSSFMANTELRFPLYKDLGGVTFLDAGALFREDLEADLGNLRYAAGLGLRYYTIIGPVQLDFGYKLNPAKKAATEDPMLVSLAKKDRWYLHFNIGQTF